MTGLLAVLAASLFVLWLGMGVDHLTQQRRERD